MQALHVCISTGSVTVKLPRFRLFESVCDLCSKRGPKSSYLHRVVTIK